MPPKLETARDGTSYDNRPDPGSSAYGYGLIPGLLPVSIYDPTKPAEERVVSKLIKGDLRVEFEHGVGGQFDIRHIDEKTARAELARLLTIMKMLRRDKKPTQRLTLYTPPILNHHTFVWLDGEKADLLSEHDRAVAFWAASGVAKAADLIVQDCHRTLDVSFSAWACWVMHTALTIRRNTGKNLVMLIGDQNHPKSASNRYEYIPAAEMVKMLKFLGKVPGVVYIERHGGYDDSHGGWFRRPYGSNPAEPQIMAALAAMSAAPAVSNTPAN